MFIDIAWEAIFAAAQLGMWRENFVHWDLLQGVCEIKLGWWP